MLVKMASSSHVASHFFDILDLIGQHRGRLNFHDALLALEARELDIPDTKRITPMTKVFVCWSLRYVSRHLLKKVGKFRKLLRYTLHGWLQMHDKGFYLLRIQIKRINMTHDMSEAPVSLQFIMRI
jgi:hypothetical protein